MNSIFIIVIAKKSIALLTHAIVAFVCPNRAIDSKESQFVTDLFSLARPKSPIVSAIDPLILNLSQQANRNPATFYVCSLSLNAQNPAQTSCCLNLMGAEHISQPD